MILIIHINNLKVLNMENLDEDFVDLYHNEQKYHRLVSTTQLLVEQENKN